MSGGVRDVDHGYKALVSKVFGMADAPNIDVGIFASDGSTAHGDGLTVLDVAIFNEFGTDSIPARSFIRAWFDENEDKNREAVKAMLVAVLEGKYSAKQALEQLAQRWVAEIQKTMAAGVPPPNAQSTIDRKGSSTPLIDTGQLRSSVTYAVGGKQKPSEATVAAAKAAKAQERAAKAADKKEFQRLKREGRAKIKNAIKRAGKDAKRAVKQARRAASKAPKQAQRAVKQASKAAQRAARKVARAARKATRRSRRR